MIVDEPQTPRAERFSAIVDAALVAWAARWPLYILIAGASVSIELIAGALTGYDSLIVALVLSVVDAFTTALVSLDVAARFANEERSLRDLARTALVRWPAVAVVLVFILFVDSQLLSWIFGSAEETIYGMLILPALAVLGVFGIASVIASIDMSLPYIAVPGFALFRSMMYVAAWPNLGRLTLAGGMVAVPLMLQQLLQHWLVTRGLGAGPSFFWSNAPVDAICLAPYQAFFTYLYLDFVVRDRQAERSR